MLQADNQFSSIPPPPPGYSLDTNVPPPPPGYSLDTAGLPNAGLAGVARPKNPILEDANNPASPRYQGGMPGSFEGHPENIGQYPVATAGRAAEGIVDMSRGNVSMGLHKEVQAVGNALAPMAPLMAAGAPVTALRALGGGVIGSKVAGAVANASGASPDQQALAEDAGNIVGGGAAATGALRAFLGSPTKALVSKAAAAAESKISPDLAEFLGPRIRAGLRVLSAAGRVADSADAANATGLGTIVKNHSEKVAELSDKLNDALSKANALPPEGPTATFKDVPDLRVQPSQQAPQNLLDRKAAFMAAQRGAQGEFPVSPVEATPAPQAAPVKATPNASIYDEPIPEKSAQQIYAEKFLQKTPPKPSLLDQLKQWDQIRQIHAQLEDQIGKGQDEIQQWMEQHNQEAPGAKSAAETAKSKFQAARAAAEGKANAVSSEAPTVAYRVRDAGETGIIPKGHAQATTDLEQAQSYVEGRGSAQNAPQEVVKVDLTKLNPSEYTLKTGPGGKTWVQFKSAVPESFIEKVGDTPRVPKDDADLENLLMKSVQNAKAKKAMSAKAGD